MLFGHQDDNTTMPNSTVTEPDTTQDTSSSVSDMTSGSSTTNMPKATPAATDSSQPPSAPAFDNPLADETTQNTPQPHNSPVANTPANGTPSNAPVAPSDLLDLKQQALSQLTPLVDHLEQTPEEKFRTTMMMIQSTDNHSLLKDAFESAQAISDDKTRAQALLDVINEINYFTQQKQQ